MDTLDEDRGKKAVTGIKGMLDERSHDHFKKVELPKIVSEKGQAFAQSNGFVDPDGRPV
jgi:hypothetical protein